MNVDLKMDTRDFRRALDHATSDTLAEMSDVVTRSTLDVQAGAIDRAPANDGELRQNIGTNFAKQAGFVTEGEVEARAPHSAFVEFGTGPAGKSAQFGALAREAMDELGYSHSDRGGFPPLDEMRDWLRKKGLDPALAFVMSRSIRKHGTRPQPFLTPALEAERDAFERDLRSALERVIRNA